MNFYRNCECVNIWNINWISNDSLYFHQQHSSHKMYNVKDIYFNKISTIIYAFKQWTHLLFTFTQNFIKKNSIFNVISLMFRVTFYIFEFYFHFYFMLLVYFTVLERSTFFINDYTVSTKVIQKKSSNEEYGGR